ncbi:MAG: fimbrillin family protein [Lepagella sp.]
MATLVCLMLTSCSNDDLESYKGMSDGICFRITADHGGDTRGNYTPMRSTSHQLVMRSENSTDTLCLRSVITDGINTTGESTRRVATRATQMATITGYGSFHVQAECREGGVLNSTYYMDDNVANQDAGVWYSDTKYYWPGSARNLKFTAWAPVAMTGMRTPATPGEDQITYSPPTSVADQTDIVVTATGEIAGDNNNTVPLTFRHICTAVRFEIGNDIIPCTIREISLKGVQKEGTYDISEDTWAMTGERGDYTLSLNFTATGNEQAGTSITGADETFILLPQTTLPAEAMVEVKILDGKSGEERTLTASLAGEEWPQGKTVTYRLSLTPEYDLEFISAPTKIDAHYVIYPIHLRAGENVEGGWALTSTDPENVTFVEQGKFANTDIQKLVEQGYWLYEYSGTSSISSTTIGEDILVYAFVKENVTEADRDITFKLTPTANSQYAPAEMEISQCCPSWNNDIGTERIEDGDYPWGFNWDSEMKITYAMPSNFLNGVRHLLLRFYIDNYPYLDDSGSVFGGNWKVTIDFSKIQKITTATNTTDGNANTWEIINYNGVNDASALMAQLESWGGTPDKQLTTNPTEFAARACAMKNRYRVEASTQGNATMYMPILDRDDMVWYLPAQEEAKRMTGNLTGDYWTSTAITDPGTTSYKYTVSGTTTGEDRNNILHVRAVRKRN